jgi:PBP1b-binding outer membrane lipoprotein LpoB
MFIKCKKRRAIAVVSLFHLFVGGCATTTTPNTSDAERRSAVQLDRTKWESVARERADARWEHISAKRFKEAFAMYTDASRRDISPDHLARDIRNIRALSGKVDTVACDADKCDVRVNVTLVIRIPRVGNKQQTVPMTEVWIPEAGEMRLIRPQ